jgi:hypothetical protein
MKGLLTVSAALAATVLLAGRPALSRTSRCRSTLAPISSAPPGRT